MVLINILSILLAIVALARSSPSTLLLVYYGLMLLRELLHVAVDKSFYSKFYPMERKRISNYTLSVTLIVVCGGLVATGILKLIFIGVELPQEFTGLF